MQLAIGRIVRPCPVNPELVDVELTADTGKVLGVWKCARHANPIGVYKVDLQDQFCYPVSLSDLEIIKK